MIQCFIVMYFIVTKLFQMTDSTHFFANCHKKCDEICIYDRLNPLFYNCKIRELKLANRRDILAYEPAGHFSLRTR